MRFVPYWVRCTITFMGVKISPEVRAAMAEVSRAFGKMGGKAAAKNMTPEQRSERAKKAATAAAKKRTAERLERERQAKVSKGN
jgi:hypothetical protein